MSDTVDSTASEANRLYWDTEQSVADIAQQLDISRRALYSAVQPEPAGRACDVCGTGMAYENRSARIADHAECPTCAESDAAEQNGRDAHEEAMHTDLAQDMGPAAVVATAALAGAVIGAIITFAVVPRR